MLSLYTRKRRCWVCGAKFQRCYRPGVPMKVSNRAKMRAVISTSAMKAFQIGVVILAAYSRGIRQCILSWQSG